VSEQGEKNAVRVEIFGEEYTLRSEAEEAYTRACAEYVDEAIRDAHLQSHVSEPHRAAILAALEITDQLFRARQTTDERDRRVAGSLDALRKRVEEALD